MWRSDVTIHRPNLRVRVTSSQKFTKNRIAEHLFLLLSLRKSNSGFLAKQPPFILWRPDDTMQETIWKKLPKLKYASHLLPAFPNCSLLFPCFLGHFFPESSLTKMELRKKKTFLWWFSFCPAARKRTVWMVLKPGGNNGINTTKLNWFSRHQQSS